MGNKQGDFQTIQAAGGARRFSMRHSESRDCR